MLGFHRFTKKLFIKKTNLQNNFHGGRFYFSQKQENEIDYPKLFVFGIGATFIISIAGVTYFYFNMDQIASKRIDNFEKQSGIAFDDFKVDKPLDDEYRMEYVI